jgi:hypothetical protein
MMPARRAGVHSGGPLSGDFAFGGAEETRTPDFLLAKEALYQLSYGPKPEAALSVAPRYVPSPDACSSSSPCRGGRFWTRTRDLCLIRAVL